ncbi:ABC transporter ATP-binding protein [Rhodococcus qingshengii]|uniref:ABC transporter ATP-binding protein n=1 Tax=Rhodococcus qingshengii TaxID=334542 RepID=UPI0022B55D37|nr:ABC transporter ATP-binding protein [Rhodococcus qingshengii]MCZ4618608.1 ABC transporter ATP-binding protein [Rhodococcus qingshengii]
MTENYTNQDRISGETLLDVSNLQKTYRSKNHTVQALGNIDFNVRRGEFVCVVGPSGAGKTTLLRCISGLLSPTSGRVELDGQIVDAPPEGMAVVFQEYGRSLFPWLSVAENVELPLKAKGLSASDRQKAVEHALQAVGLADVPRSFPWQLSGGMQQRVAIARAIAYRPAILLMDEPFAAVDAQTRSELEDLVRKLWKELGVTVLFVTHDIDESVYLGERVVVLSSRPTIVLDDVHIGLPAERDQLTTRSSNEFAELRARVYQRIQEAKNINGDNYTPETVGTRQVPV